jgi:hypothetical protein
LNRNPLAPFHVYMAAVWSSTSRALRPGKLEHCAKLNYACAFSMAFKIHHYDNFDQ